MLILIFISILLVNVVSGSPGDRSKFFQNCIDKCSLSLCEDDGINFINQKPITFVHKIFQWPCFSECEYDCMWKTVDAFHAHGYPTPQFYGKWPFKRFFGIQEPASALFSLFNFYGHIRGILKFRNEVRKDSPFYRLWHIFCLVNLNGWIWSTVFHCRDTEQTESLDYACAFAIVLMNCLVMILRLMKDIPRFLKIILTVFVLAFYINHVSYLKLERFDYAYNMKVNLAVGCFTCFVWFNWCIYNRIRQPYVWKCGLYITLVISTTLLELIDRPPLFYVLDSHAMWHLSTSLFVFLFYSFAIDDCKYLRKQVYNTMIEDQLKEK